MLASFFFRYLICPWLIVALVPVWVIVSILVACDTTNNPFFLQQRLGYRGQVFTIYKFRTIRNEKVSTLGRFLRKFGIDELPQLLNILLNEMNLIGPRPLLPEYLSKFTDVQRKRLDVLPGITGWAQVHGRNLLSWTDKFNLDVWYVSNRSFLVDTKILFLTVYQLFKKVNGSDPIEKF